MASMPCSSFSKARIELILPKLKVVEQIGTIAKGCVIVSGDRFYRHRVKASLLKLRPGNLTILKSSTTHGHLTEGFPTNESDQMTESFSKTPPELTCKLQASPDDQPRGCVTQCWPTYQIDLAKTQVIDIA
jgi:hypothetical protein